MGTIMISDLLLVTSALISDFMELNAGL